MSRKRPMYDEMAEPNEEERGQLMAMRALLNCQVIRAPLVHPAYSALASIGIAHDWPVLESFDSQWLCDYRLTDRGREYAKQVLR